MCEGVFGFLAVVNPREGHRNPTPTGWIVALATRDLLIVVLLVPSSWALPPGRATARRGYRCSVRQRRDPGYLLPMVGRACPCPCTCWRPIACSAHASSMLCLQPGPGAAFQSALLIVDPLDSIAIGVEPFEELLNNSPLDLLFGCSFAWPCSRGGAHDQVGADPHGSQKQTLTSHDRQRLLTVGRRRRESPSPRLGVSSESTVALCRGGRFRGPVADSEPGLSSAAV